MKIKGLCTYGAKSSLKAGDAVSNGQYMFFTSSSDETKRYSEHQYDGEYIVMGTGGKASLHYYNGKFSTSSDCVVLLPNVGVRAKYLYYFFLKNMDVLEAGFKGAGLKHTNKEYIGNIEIKEIPDTIRQDKIIAVLDTAARVMEFRQQQLQKLDELVKARFIELFGDPVDNDRAWPTETLNSVCSTIVDCPHSTPSYTSDNTGYMCIRTSIVKKNHIMWDEIEYISEQEYYQRIQRKRPARGDVIYTREGAILGIAAMIDRECNVALGQRSMLLSPNTYKCLPQFLSAAMNFDSFLRKALGGVSGSASPHINVGDIKAFAIILPPIELQEQFAAFVEQTDKSKLAVQKALDEAQMLFDSLMQEFFG